MECFNSRIWFFVVENNMAMSERRSLITQFAAGGMEQSWPRNPGMRETQLSSLNGKGNMCPYRILRKPWHIFRQKIYNVYQLAKFPISGVWWQKSATQQHCFNTVFRLHVRDELEKFRCHRHQIPRQTRSERKLQQTRNLIWDIFWHNVEWLVPSHELKRIATKMGRGAQGPTSHHDSVSSQPLAAATVLKSLVGLISWTCKKTVAAVVQIRWCNNSQQPTTNNKQQPTSNSKQQTTNNKQPTTNNQQPTTSNQQPTTNNQQPTTSNQQPANSKQQTANSKQQTANSKQQTAKNKQQTTNNKQHTTNNKQQTTNNKQR